jgi:hypothetical protein
MRRSACPPGTQQPSGKARQRAAVLQLHLHDLWNTGNTLAAETGATPLTPLVAREWHGAPVPAYALQRSGL